MNELFLVSICLLCSLIKGNDKAPALFYGLAAHIFYFISLWTNNVALLFMIGGVSDLLVILLLACLGGCLRSRLVYFLIPLSLVSAGLHYYGWVVVMKEADPTMHYSLVIFYMCVIIALFAFSAGGYGHIGWNPRLLPRDNSGNKDMAMVAK